MTNDTEFADRVTNPDIARAQDLLVKASALLTDDDLQALRDGVTLRDGPTRPARVRRVDDSSRRTSFEITLTEGRNRQVRRMVKASALGSWNSCA